MSVLQSRSVNVPISLCDAKQKGLESPPAPQITDANECHRQVCKNHEEGEKEVCKRKQITKNGRVKRKKESFHENLRVGDVQGMPEVSGMSPYDTSQWITGVEATAAQYYYYYYYYYYPALLAAQTSSPIPVSLEPCGVTSAYPPPPVPEIPPSPYAYGLNGTGVPFSFSSPSESSSIFPVAANAASAGAPSSHCLSLNSCPLSAHIDKTSSSTVYRSPVQLLQGVQANVPNFQTNQKPSRRSTCRPRNSSAVPEPFCPSTGGFLPTEKCNSIPKRKLKSQTLTTKRCLEVFSGSVSKAQQEQQRQLFFLPEKEYSIEEKLRKKSTEPEDPLEVHGVGITETDVGQLLDEYRGHILELARTEEGKMKLQHVIRCARRLGSVSSATMAMKKTIPEGNVNCEDEFASVSGAATNQLLAQCVRLILTELSEDISNAGLDENACHILRSAIAHCHDISLIHTLVVSKLSDTTILNWCTATHYSRGIIETLFAKERSTIALMAGNSTSAVTESLGTTSGSLVSHVLKVMRRNTTYLAVMQQGCICFTHCYGKYCSREQQRQWLLESETKGDTQDTLASSEKTKVQFSHFLCPLLKDLSLDCYGNYTVQCILRDSLDKQLIRTCAREFLLPHLVTLSLHKQGSNVVETLIQHLATPLSAVSLSFEPDSAIKKRDGSRVNCCHHITELEEKERKDILMLRNEILLTFGLLLPDVDVCDSKECTTERNKVLDSVICNAYGNFVVQAILTNLFPSQYLVLSHSNGVSQESPRVEANAACCEKAKGDDNLLSLSDTHWSTERSEIFTQWPPVRQRCLEALTRSGCPYTAKLERLLQRGHGTETNM